MGNAIHSTLASDPDFQELVEMFVDEMPTRVATIRESIAGNDTATLKRAVHQLRGSCGGYGFDSLTYDAGRIEDQLRAGRSIADVEAELNALIDSLERITADPE